MFGVEQAYHGTLTGRGRPLLSAGQMVALVDVDIRTPRHADERASRHEALLPHGRAKDQTGRTLVSFAVRLSSPTSGRRTSST